MRCLRNTCPRPSAKRTSRPAEGRDAATPARREKKIREPVRSRRKTLTISEPPRFRCPRHAVHVHVFYSNHFKQSKSRMRAAPSACSASTVRSLANAIIARDVVHHDGACPEPRSDGFAELGVAGPNACAQAELGIICPSNRLVDRFDRGNREHRSESLFSHQLHRVIHIRDDRWLEEART